MDTITLSGELSDRDSWTAESCTLAAALDVVGRRASMLLLREAFYGATKFEEFVRRAGFSEKITAARLRDLVDEGLLLRRPYQDPGQRSRDGYHLTDKGAALLPALVALMQWGDHWTQGGRGPIDLQHRGCSKLVKVEFRCEADHSVKPDGIEVVARHIDASGGDHT